MSLLTGPDISVWKTLCARLAVFGAEDIYFCPEYFDLYTDAGTRAEVFIYEEGQDLFFFLYLRRNLPEPFEAYSDFETVYGYSGPMTNRADADFLIRAWEQFQKQAKESRLIAGLIRFHPLLDNYKWMPAGKGREVLRLRNTVRLNLNQRPEEVWSGYHPNTRNKILKARKQNVRIERDATAAGLRAFGEHYRKRMADVGAGSFYHFEDLYFDKIARNLKDFYALFLAYQDDRLVGGVLTLESRKMAHLHLSAVDAEAQSTGAASLLRHTAIDYYLGKKNWFHFGGGTTNREDDPVYKFKCGFSPERGDFWIGKILVNPEIYAEVCGGWEAAHPEKKEASQNILLKYRM